MVGSHGHAWRLGLALILVITVGGLVLLDAVMAQETAPPNTTSGSPAAAGTATSTTQAVYHLPAPAGTALTVRRGNGDPGFRTNQEAYAFDFVAAEGPSRFPVTAARGGTVISARSGVPGGRCRSNGETERPACWRQVNYVLIDHGDGTSGLYLHLRPGKLPVHSGEVVSAGQVIGTAGDTGWTEGIGLGFQVQRTPAWFEQGRGGWFLTQSLPVSFSDPEVLAVRPDGVPEAGDTFISGSPEPLRPPFRLRRRPTDLPAAVPFEATADRRISSAYDADSPDGYGLHIAPLVEATGAVPGNGSTSASSNGAAPTATPRNGAPGTVADDGTIVRPLFGGELAYAGCASGASASLGRMVAVQQAVGGVDYLAVLGHLSEIEPSLLGLDATQAPLSIGPNDYLGRYGVILAPGRTPALECPAAAVANGAESANGSASANGSTPANGARSTADDIFVGILRDATVTPDGEIVGGTPVSPEPLVGGLGYEGFAWWSGPLTAVTLAEGAGRPRAGWNARTPGNAGHVVFGDPITLAARVRDATDIAQVRFRAWYPEWPRTAGTARLDSFRPTSSWRQLALCSPPGAGGQNGAGGVCRWKGTARNAVVSIAWDPSLVPVVPTAPWLPRARPAMTRDSTACVPVSLAVEVIDTSGRVYSEIGRLPLPATCDARGVARSRIGRVLYLEPLVPPQAPAPRGDTSDRGWPPVYAPDPLDGAIVWRDRSDNEDGFKVYARRSWLEVDCSVTNGPWTLVKELPADTVRYRPQHARVVRSIDVPRIEGVPGNMNRWEYAVSAFNEAGETAKVPVGGFIGGSEAFCDPGLEPPPDL
jgi:murein DD-endopeptidase MepM/ murein hydrolase activator NlpD